MEKAKRMQTRATTQLHMNINAESTLSYTPNTHIKSEYTDGGTSRWPSTLQNTVDCSEDCMLKMFKLKSAQAAHCINKERLM